MLDLTYQHQATTQLYVQALIGIFFWLALRDISIYADMTLAAIIYLGMSAYSNSSDSDQTVQAVRLR
ncbi:hypothetical protein, partial [Escherichia coli]|uniref:hypothetical protein n=1 Tax=Escherichia coli TaxID=562 RepID=UPI0008FF067A